MRIIAKIRLIVIVAWMFIIAIIVFQSYYSMMNNYLLLEKKDIQIAYARGDEAINRMVESLTVFTGDWAHWTDTYEFILHKTPSYIESNLSPITTFKESRLNYILYFDDKGNYFYGKSYNDMSNSFVPVPEELLVAIKKYPTLTKHDEVKEHASGFVGTDNYPIVVSSQPITNNDLSATPNGNIIMGFIFDVNRVAKLAKTLQAPLEFITIDNIKSSNEMSSIYNSFSNTVHYKAVHVSAKELEIYSSIKDLNGNPIGMIRMTMPRSTYLLGLNSVRQAIGIEIVTGIIVLLLLEYLLRYFVLNRLFQFNNELKRITQKSDFNREIPVNGNDEISDLIKSSNEMLSVINSSYLQMIFLIYDIAIINKKLNEQMIAREAAEAELAEINNQLILASRQAGMADIASSVLHNVGNVLNSVNITSTMIYDRIKHTEINRINYLVEILEQNQNNLTDFLTNDPKGKNVLAFITMLAKKWETDRVILMGESKELIAHIDNIKNIITAQQSMSTLMAVMEKISIEELIEDAMLFCKSFMHHDNSIEVKIDCEKLPDVITDKVKLLQILVNLIKNAIESLNSSTCENKLLHIKAYALDNRYFKIDIYDNGTGISHDVMSNLFSLHYSTKKRGHGIGLHTSALSAKELGGKLTVKSDGQNKGATFTIMLPFKLHEKGKPHEPREGEKDTHC